MTGPVSQDVLERINAIHTKFQRPGDRVARDQAVADALGCPPPHQPTATANANIANISSQAQLLTIVVGNPVNRTFQALEGTGATVSGTMYYRELWDLTGAQPVATSFGAGQVTIAIGSMSSRAFVLGRERTSSPPRSMAPGTNALARHKPVCGTASFCKSDEMKVV
ncbi:hypothetical protein FRC10_010616 [Ceratobasidium sp. 414]|nr:hypothetical protein FRC10_010616 [Ceratobasidium sp. 414]